MQIKITYVGTLNGINGIWCGFKPEGAIITEERPVLYAEAGYTLIRKSDEEKIGNSVWLRDGDTQDNYYEIEDDTENSEVET